MKNLYMMTEAQIETLAAERTQSLVAVDTSDGTYLRAIVTGAQSKLGPKRGKRPNDNTQLDAIEAIAVPFYAAVLRGVVTTEIALDANMEAGEVSRRTRERNRRATFARTAKSTLATWVKSGGDIRGLDVAKLTKTELRTAITAARGERGLTVASRVEKAQGAILAAVAREGPDAQREHLERVIAALQAVLDEVPETGTDHGTTAIIRGRSPETPATFRGHVRRVPATARAAA